MTGTVTSSGLHNSVDGVHVSFLSHMNLYGGTDFHFRSSHSQTPDHGYWARASVYSRAFIGTHCMNGKQMTRMCKRTDLAMLLKLRNSRCKFGRASMSACDNRTTTTTTHHFYCYCW